MKESEKKCPTPADPEIQDTKSKRHSNVEAMVAVALRKRKDPAILGL